MSSSAAAWCAVAVFALAGCGAGMHSTATVQNRQAASSVRMPYGHNEGDDLSRVARGAEVESGMPVIVTIGNHRIGFPPSAKVTRSANAVTVTVNGRTRTFSADAVVSRNGEFHRYAAVEK